MVASRDENAVEIASADGDVADGEIPCVAEEEHAEQMSAVADGARGIDFPSRAVDETAVAAAERLDDGVRIVGADTVGGLFPDAAFDEHVMVKSLGRKRMNPAVGGIGVADHDAAATVHHVDDGLRMDGQPLSGRKDDRPVQKKRKRQFRNLHGEAGGQRDGDGFRCANAFLEGACGHGDAMLAGFFTADDIRCLHDRI